MQNGIDPTGLIRMPRARLLASVTLLSGVLVAGCGGAGNSSQTTQPGASQSASSVVADTGTTSSTATSSALPTTVSPGVAFARCMRASGVPNFPDPQPGGGFLFSVTGLDRSSPAFRAAQIKCRRLLPSGGPPVPGSTTHPSARTLAKLVGIAQCMRRHGVPDFPDPRTSVPLNPFPSGEGVITDYDGAILLFPSTLNMESPSYTQAATGCGTLAEKLGHGPHG